MIADHSSIGSSELFIPVSLGNGKIALQTVGSNRFVCAENSGAAPLVADRLSQGAWEIFQLAGAGLAAPEGFSATAGNATVLLTWNPVGGATSYSVKRATTSGGPFIQIATPIGYNCTDSGAIGVTCYYVVSASDSAGAGSPNSTEVAAMPQPLVTQQSPEFNLQEITRSSQFSFTGNAGALTYKSSVAGHTYQMQNSNSMADGSWKDAGDPQPGTGGDLQFAIPSAPPVPAQVFPIRNPSVTPVHRQCRAVKGEDRDIGSSMIPDGGNIACAHCFRQSTIRRGNRVTYSLASSMSSALDSP